MLTTSNAVSSPTKSVSGALQDERVIYVRSKISQVEKHVKELRDTLEGYVRNHERLRRKSLKMAVCLKSFSEFETPELSHVLSGIADALTEMQTTRALMQDRVDILSQEPLKVYKTACSKIRSDLKARDNALQSESRRQRALDNTMIKEPGNVAKVNQHQIELTAANSLVVNSTNALTNDMLTFEQRKIVDVKNSLNEFLHSSIAYHAKSLEILSRAHKLLRSASFSSDLEEVEQKLSPKPNEIRSAVRFSNTKLNDSKSPLTSDLQTPMEVKSPQSAESKSA